MAKKKAQTTTASPSATDTTDRHTDHHHDGHTLTIPLDDVADAARKAVTLPVTAAQRVLPAKGGLPLYAGLGALALAGALEWPVAAGIGIGYAVLRRGGALPPPPAPRTPARTITVAQPKAPKPEADSSS
ncbi:hypothetical protein [Streptomyces sp. NPDC020996]|uniref:hypothetical protein n=1 Tax=Streptomyces sp. NPDC020996 TaxID=3154791 RepID=UPI003406D03F